jgi:hypothetical protein
MLDIWLAIIYLFGYSTGANSHGEVPEWLNGAPC